MSVVYLRRLLEQISMESQCGVEAATVIANLKKADKIAREVCAGKDAEELQQRFDILKQLYDMQSMRGDFQGAVETVQELVKV